jgi:hypothetical protein
MGAKRTQTANAQLTKWARSGRKTLTARSCDEGRDHQGYFGRYARGCMPSLAYKGRALEWNLMEQIRERTWVTMHYRDAILHALNLGLTYPFVAKLLEEATGMKWTATQLRKHVQRHLLTAPPFTVVQRDLSILDSLDGKVAFAQTNEKEVPPQPHSPQITPPTPLRYPQPIATTATFLPGWSSTVADARDPETSPHIPHKFNIENFEPRSYQPGTLVGEPIVLDDGATAQWGSWAIMDGAQPLWFDCQIEHPSGLAVRFGLQVRDPDAIKVWMYKTDLTPMSTTETFDHLTNEATARDSTKNNQIPSYGPTNEDTQAATQRYYDERHFNNWSTWYKARRLGLESG